MIILGIDPGSARIGYGLIEKRSGYLFYLDSGLIPLPKTQDKNIRLFYLEKNLIKLIKRIRPKKIGIEKIFFVKNKKTAVEVGQARGVIMNTIYKSRVPFVEFAPSEIKLAVTGNGRATKQAIIKMVPYLLKNSKNIDISIDDPIDALAIAITASLINL